MPRLKQATATERARSSNKLSKKKKVLLAIQKRWAKKSDHDQSRFDPTTVKLRPNRK